MSTPDSAPHPATRDQDDPAPMKATAHLLGGLHDGDEWMVPAHCHRIDLPDGTPGFITVHPSFLLRQPDEASRAREYAVMRAVGAGSALLRSMQRAELLGVGALLGGLGWI